MKKFLQAVLRRHIQEAKPMFFEATFTFDHWNLIYHWVQMNCAGFGEIADRAILTEFLYVTFTVTQNSQNHRHITLIRSCYLNQRGPFKLGQGVKLFFHVVVFNVTFTLLVIMNVLFNPALELFFSPSNTKSSSAYFILSFSNLSCHLHPPA